MLKTNIIFQFDLNNDGILDDIRHGPSFTPRYDRAGKLRGHSDGYAIQPQLNIKMGRRVVIKLFQEAPPSFSGLRGHKFAFAEKGNPRIRFYDPYNYKSYTNGQIVGFKDEDGHLKTMRIDGFVIGVNPVRIDPDLPHIECIPIMGDAQSQKVVQWVYEQDPKTGQVIQQAKLQDIFWGIIVNGGFETIDLNRIMSGKKNLTRAEALLVPIFRDTRGLAKKHPHVSKREVAHHLETIISQWKISSRKEDPNRIKEILKPVLWVGILGALAKLAGLKPANLLK